MGKILLTECLRGAAIVTECGGEGCVQIPNAGLYFFFIFQWPALLGSRAVVKLTLDWLALVCCKRSHNSC